MEKTYCIPKWDNSFSVGNERIDHQHHYFLNLIEYLNENIDSAASKERIRNYLEEVILYARFHFCSEENMMIQFGYPDYEHHKELHAELFREITDRITHFSINKADISDIVQFLADWFINHTISEDRKFHQSIKSR